MTGEQPIGRGYVVIRDGVIVTVGAGAPKRGIVGFRIDGRGGTLIPGLADMHVHYDRPELGIAFVANGITTVRNMYGGLVHARLDEAARVGALVGPRVYTTGPIINAGYFVRVDNPDQAVGAIRSQAGSGYQAVKLYQNLSATSFRAAVAEAHTLGLKVFCHVPFSMSVYDVLALGVDSIEHLTGYGAALVRDDFRPSALGAYSETWANVDRAKFDRLVKATIASGTWSVPTFALTYGSMYWSDVRQFFRRPEAAYLPASVTQGWKMFEKGLSSDRPFVREGLRQKIAFVTALRNAGAPILIGTDASNPYVIPGFALHDEIAAFSMAGYSNREILRIATVDAARFLGERAHRGMLVPGERADMVLLRSDPITDLQVLRRPVGVMVNGNWYDRARLDRALTELAAKVRNERAVGDSGQGP